VGTEVRRQETFVRDLFDDLRVARGSLAGATSARSLTNLAEGEMRHLLTLAVLLGGCGGEVTAGEEQGLNLTQHTMHELAGRFVRGAITVDFRAVESSQVVTQSYQIGDLLVRVTSDHAQGVGRLDSSGAVLSDGQKAALGELNRALEDQLPTERILVEDAVYRGSGYLASAQANEMIPSFEFRNFHSITYIAHCWCSWQYIGCTSGKGCYWHTVGTGFGCVGELAGNGCKGRCGAGCPSNGHSGAYTYDCARHDYNLESWTAASDDYLFAGWNC
jgi:hypothetical protein